jgi:hypothetical protein
MNEPSHHPAREPRNVSRLSRTFSRSLSAVDLAEPLLSLDENQPVTLARELLKKRRVSVLGVRRAGLIAGWVAASDLEKQAVGECARGFRSEMILAEGAGLDAVIGALSNEEQVFVEWLGEVTGVITRNDLQKPPVRMWLFGAITVLDANLTWAIEDLFPGDSWQSRISAGRFEKAVALRSERERRGGDCRLVDCLQIKDKADVLLRDKTSMEAMGLASRREAERLASDVEKLRNHLAHAQELEPAHLATTAQLAASIQSIVHGEGVGRIVAAHRAPLSTSS